MCQPHQFGIALVVLGSKPDRVERPGRLVSGTNAVSRQEKVKADFSRRPTEEQPKRKMVSPVEGNKVLAVTKKPRKGEPSYAEVCGSTEAADYSERERSDSNYVVERRRRGKKRRPPEPQTLGERGRGRDGGGAGRRLPPRRRRKEAILIKIDEGREWMVYRKIMAVRSTIVGSTGIRRTRAGHILIEFDREVAVNEMAEKLKAALSDRMEVSVLVNRVTL